MDKAVNFLFLSHRSSIGFFKGSFMFIYLRVKPIYLFPTHLDKRFGAAKGGEVICRLRKLTHLWISLSGTTVPCLISTRNILLMSPILPHLLPKKAFKFWKSQELLCSSGAKLDGRSDFPFLRSLFLKHSELTESYLFLVRIWANPEISAWPGETYGLLVK